MRPPDLLRNTARILLYPLFLLNCVLISVAGTVACCPCLFIYCGRQQKKWNVSTDEYYLEEEEEEVEDIEAGRRGEGLGALPDDRPTKGLSNPAPPVMILPRRPSTLPTVASSALLNLKDVQYRNFYHTAADGTRLAVDVWLPPAYTTTSSSSSSSSSCQQVETEKKVGCIFHQARYYRSFKLWGPANMARGGRPISLINNQYFEVRLNECSRVGGWLGDDAKVLFPYPFPIAFPCKRSGHRFYGHPGLGRLVRTKQRAVDGGRNHRLARAPGLDCRPALEQRQDRVRTPLAHPPIHVSMYPFFRSIHSSHLFTRSFINPPTCPYIHSPTHPPALQSLGHLVRGDTRPSHRHHRPLLHQSRRSHVHLPRHLLRRWVSPTHPPTTPPTQTPTQTLNSPSTHHPFHPPTHPNSFIGGMHLRGFIKNWETITRLLDSNKLPKVTHPPTHPRTHPPTHT